MGIRPWVRIGCGCRLRAQYHCRLRCTTRPDRARARPDHGAGLSPCARNTIREATSQARPSRQHAEHAVRRNRTRSAAGHLQRSPPAQPEASATRSVVDRVAPTTSHRLNILFIYTPMRLSGHRLTSAATHDEEIDWPDARCRNRLACRRLAIDIATLSVTALAETILHCSPMHIRTCRNKYSDKISNQEYDGSRK